ncbi:secreted RxLR effector protein 161-like, partial [Capsicum annuum]|uniref:secreted RxLR effector protein 161-like n=1 Tax=Capsicum annuum TaxID=4072 RepID=UPI001FB0BAB7
MEECNLVNTPTEFGVKLNKDKEGKKVNSTLYKQIVGSLIYLTTTRPDIMLFVGLISRYMENPTENHLFATKRILRYLKGTRDFGLFYKKGARSNLIGFTDSDFACDQDDRKSTSGHEEAIVIYCDNNFAIKLSQNPVLHGRSKHIDVKYHYLCELTNEK